MTKRTVLLLALAATTGVPALAACSNTERQAPLPPDAASPVPGTNAAGQMPGTPSSAGGSVPLTADGHPVPTSGAVGANVGPGPVGGSGGLRTRPGYVPGPAGTSALPDDTYRVGARAPWGILLDERPRSEPLPIPPAPDVNPRRGNGNAQPDSGAGGGAAILADAPTPQARAEPHDSSGGTQLPSSVSFPALLSVLPPSTESPVTEAPTADDSVLPPVTNTADKPGKGPHGKDAEPAGQPVDSQPADQAVAAVPSPVTSPDLPAEVPGPTASPLLASSAPVQVPAPGVPTASGWRIDGLALSSAAPAPTGKGGSVAFRKALRASLDQRPDGARPAPAVLRRWSASLQKAATLAPDARTRTQLRMLARYAADLADTAAPQRTALQQKRPGAMHAASALRASLPRRFGISLLG